MPSPTFVAYGDQGFPGFGTPPGIPPGIQSGDILVCYVVGHTATVPTMPAGWTLWTPLSRSEPTMANLCGHVFWKRTTGTETAPAVTGMDTGSQSAIMAYRGCAPSGDPLVANTFWNVDSAPSNELILGEDLVAGGNCRAILFSACEDAGVVVVTPDDPFDTAEWWSRNGNGDTTSIVVCGGPTGDTGGAYSPVVLTNSSQAQLTVGFALSSTAVAEPISVLPATASFPKPVSTLPGVTVTPKPGVPISITPALAVFPSPVSTRPGVYVPNPNALRPMPRLALGRPTAGDGEHARLVNGRFRSGLLVAWEATAGQQAAVDIGTGYDQILVQLGCEDSNGGDFNAAWQGGGWGFTDYRLFTSADSTDGINGTWTLAATVTDNTYLYRQHLVAFAGQRWLRVVADADATIDELEVWDATAGTDDTWAFLGDSITNRATKRGDQSYHGNQPSFQKQVFDAFGQWPAQTGMGHVGWGPADYLADDGGITRIDRLLQDFPHIRNWAIALGTNNSFAGPGGQAAFEADMATIIAKIQDGERVAHLAKMPYTTETGRGGPDASADAGYQPSYTLAYNEGLVALAADNGIEVVADLYAPFAANPGLLSDGVHPNVEGCVAWNTAWFEAARDAGLYSASAGEEEPEAEPISVTVAAVASFPSLTSALPSVTVGVAPDASEGIPSLDTSNFFPLPGSTLTRTYPLGFDATPAPTYSVQVVVDFGGGWRELAHTPDGFTPLYSALSTREELAAGELRFRIARAGGWPASPTLRLSNTKD